MAEIALGLKTVNADMTSHGGFVWPESGHVEAPDWSPKPVCGGGLHFFAWGEGDGSLANWSPNARWLVIEYDPATAVDLNGKQKVPRATVVFCGGRFEATEYLSTHGGAGKAIIGATVSSTGGDGATVTCTGGDEATVSSTGGDGATVSSTGGDGATVSSTGGDEATVSSTGGDQATVTCTGGYEATVSSTGGDQATVTCTGGYGATVTCTGGDGATVTCTGGYGATVTCTGGYWATIIANWWDDSANRQRTTVGYIGEDGLEPNVPYRCRKGAWQKVESTSGMTRNVKI